MKRLSLFLLLAFLFLSNYALAQTPDDMTPAEESVCDGLSGAAFGLCNAYCEALDCDLDAGYDQHPKACDKVLANFMKKTDGEEPPCLGSVCTPEDIECGGKPMDCLDGAGNVCGQFCSKTFNNGRCVNVRCTCPK